MKKFTIIVIVIMLGLPLCVNAENLEAIEFKTDMTGMFGYSAQKWYSDEYYRGALAMCLCLDLNIAGLISRMPAENSGVGYMAGTDADFLVVIFWNTDTLAWVFYCPMLDYATVTLTDIESESAGKYYAEMMLERCDSYYMNDPAYMDSIGN